MATADPLATSKNRADPAVTPRIEWVPIGKLRFNPRNARTHSRKQIKQIAASIKKFGFLNPVLVDDADMVLAGHGRLEAARLEGLTHAPIIRFGHLTQAQKRAYVLADNKLALNAGWDEELLALELKELMEADIDFGVDITGFSIAEVDQLIEGLAPSEPGDPADDRLPEPEAVPSRCQPGDLWRLGPHRLICGDALDPRIVADLLEGEKAARRPEARLSASNARDGHDVVVHHRRADVGSAPRYSVAP
jgi:hypothetical protein